MACCSTFEIKWERGTRPQSVSATKQKNLYSAFSMVLCTCVSLRSTNRVAGRLSFPDPPLNTTNTVVHHCYNYAARVARHCSGYHAQQSLASHAWWAPHSLLAKVA